MDNILDEEKQEVEYLQLNECVQIGDKVKLDGQKGFVIGEINGQVIVQIQGNTSLVDPSKLKTEKQETPEITPEKQFKFDEVTQKLLFEQYIKCGVYMGNVPIKLSDCFVRYDLWQKAKDDDNVKVLIEGSVSFMPKSQVRIFEDLNDFANEDNYVPGVIIDEGNEDALENILINAVDYSNAIGDADAVKIIRKTPDGQQEMQTMPKGTLRTLSV